MPNYYLTVEKVGKSSTNVDGNGRLTWRDLPDCCCFALEVDAAKLQPGDMVLDYVAPSDFGFAAVMRVDTWESGVAYISDRQFWREYPFRGKVRTLCLIRDRKLMPKWWQLRPDLDWCRGLSVAGANFTLHTTLRKINEHDYNLIATAICNAVKGTSVKGQL